MAMYLVDSDFDTEDEYACDDIEEVISNHIVNNSQASDDNSIGSPPRCEFLEDLDDQDVDGDDE